MPEPCLCRIGKPGKGVLGNMLRIRKSREIGSSAIHLDGGERWSLKHIRRVVNGLRMRNQLVDGIHFLPWIRARTGERDQTLGCGLMGVAGRQCGVIDATCGQYAKRETRTILFQGDIEQYVSVHIELDQRAEIHAGRRCRGESQASCELLGRISCLCGVYDAFGGSCRAGDGHGGPGRGCDQGVEVAAHHRSAGCHGAIAGYGGFVGAFTSVWFGGLVDLRFEIRSRASCKRQKKGSGGCYRQSLCAMKGSVSKCLHKTVE